MNVRNGFLWAVHIRPCTDISGESDVVICTPDKDICKSRSKECIGEVYDIVWQGWVKDLKKLRKRVIK